MHWRISCYFGSSLSFICNGWVPRKWFWVLVCVVLGCAVGGIEGRNPYKKDGEKVRKAKLLLDGGIRDCAEKDGDRGGGKGEGIEGSDGGDGGHICHAGDGTNGYKNDGRKHGGRVIDRGSNGGGTGAGGGVGRWMGGLSRPGVGGMGDNTRRSGGIGMGGGAVIGVGIAGIGGRIPRMGGGAEIGAGGGISGRLPGIGGGTGMSAGGGIGVGIGTGSWDGGFGSGFGRGYGVGGGRKRIAQTEMKKKKKKP